MEVESSLTVKERQKNAQTTVTSPSLLCWAPQGLNPLRQVTIDELRVAVEEMLTARLR
jgi:hypothetical protein